MRSDPLSEKSYLFAIEIVNLCRYLSSDKKEYILSKQLLRSGTSVGAMIREAEYAQSRADFTHKMSIALKECNESRFWISLMLDTKIISTGQSSILVGFCQELIYMLVATVRKSKENEGMREMKE